MFVQLLRIIFLVTGSSYGIDINNLDIFTVYEMLILTY